MDEGTLFTTWDISLGIAAGVILIAAILLMAVWLSARRILRLATEALELVKQIEANTQSIWKLKDTNDVATQILTEATAIGEQGAEAFVGGAIACATFQIGNIPGRNAGLCGDIHQSQFVVRNELSQHIGKGRHSFVILPLQVPWTHSSFIMNS